MTIRIGTIHELTGKGIEIMVDVPTRSIVLAQFYDGNFVRNAVQLISNDETTLISSEVVADLVSP